MKPSTLRLLAVSASVLAVAWVAYLLRMGPGHDPSRLPRLPPGVPPLSKTGGPLADAGQDGAPAPLDPAVVARMKQWLAERGRDADGLIALYDVTGRIELLHEAADKYPGYPTVCLVMIRHLRDKPREALPWIERFLADDPNNVEGYFLKNWALARLGEHSGGLDVLRHIASNWMSRHTHRTHRGVNVSRAALAAGLDESTASLIGSSCPGARGGFSLASEGLYATSRKEIQSAKDSGDADRIRSIANIVVALTPHIVPNTGTGIQEELLTLSLELEALELLPADTKVGIPGTTVSERHTLARKRQDDAQRMLLAQDETTALLANATEPMKRRYVDAFFVYGEAAAAQSLREVIPSHPPR